MVEHTIDTFKTEASRTMTKSILDRLRNRQKPEAMAPLTPCEQTWADMQKSSTFKRNPQDILDMIRARHQKKKKTQSSGTK